MHLFVSEKGWWLLDARHPSHVNTVLDVIAPSFANSLYVNLAIFKRRRPENSMLFSHLDYVLRVSQKRDIKFNDTTQIEASTAKELFKYILPIINEASKKMKVILDHFHVERTMST